MSKSSLDSILEVTQDDFLKVLYEHRNNNWELISLNMQTKIKPIKDKKKEKYNNFIQVIKENLKDVTSIEKIQQCLQEFLDICNNEDGIYNEQYYNTGVADGVKLMLQCFKQG